MRAFKSIQPEERDKIRRFRYKSDAKASLCGRILIRRWIKATFDLQNQDVQLQRTMRGKPFFKPPGEDAGFHFDFNISHAGHYVAFVSQTADIHTKINVGVDVMPLTDESREKDAKFFYVMDRKFSPTEWTYIRQEEDPKVQLSRFFRLWALKESFIKATGFGLSVDLQDLAFEPKQELKPDAVIRSTHFKVETMTDPRWVFSEFKIDNHAVAVCSNHVLGNNDLPFDVITDFNTVLDELDPRNDYDDNDEDKEWSDFEQKLDKKPF